MKKVKAIYSRSRLPRATLYRDDIESISSLISDACGSVVFIVNGTDEYDDFNELAEKERSHRIPRIRIGDKTNGLKFSRVDIMLGSGADSITVNLDDPLKQEGLAAQVMDIVERRKSKLDVFYGPVTQIITGTTAGALAGAAFIFSGSIDRVLMAQVFALALAIGLFGFWWAYEASFRRGVVIKLDHSRDDSSFWTDNWPAILLAVGTAILGAIVNSLFTIWLQRPK